MTAKQPQDKTNSEIIDDVSLAFARARTKGTNWVDYLPDYLDCDESLADDPDYVGSLANGRVVFFAPHTMDGFSISEVEQ
jgi:hypothetical protein